MSNIIQNECESTKLEILIEVARRANWDALHGPMHLKTGRFHIMFNADNRYLGIRAGSLTELAPRQQILSTAYAVKAQRADVSDTVPPNYDSGWFAENNYTTHVTTKTHNLGVYPTKVQVWFSETNPPTGFIVVVPTTTHGQLGGPESLRVSTTNIEYSIPANGDCIAYWWYGSGASLYSSGYYRILLWK